MSLLQPNSPIVVVSAERSSCSFPTEWECRGDGGLVVYAYYMHGELFVGSGSTIGDAVANALNGQFRKRIGKHNEGELEYTRLKEETEGYIKWPEKETDDDPFKWW